MFPTIGRPLSYGAVFLVTLLEFLGLPAPGGLPIARIDITSIVERLQLVGWGFVVLILLLGARQVIRVVAWRHCLKHEDHRPGLFQLFGLRLVDEAFGDITPAGPLLGESVKVWAGSTYMPAGSSAASVAIEDQVYALSSALFISGGIALLVFDIVAPERFQMQAGGVAGFLLFSIIGLALIVGRCDPLLGAVLDWLKLRGALWHYLDKTEQRIRNLGAKIHNFFWARKKTCLFILILVLAASLTGIAEAFLIFRVTTGHAYVITAHLVEAANRVPHLVFIVFLGFGAEGATAGAMLAALGYTTSVAVALAVIRKGRIIFWKAVGLLLAATISSLLLFKKLALHQVTVPVLTLWVCLGLAPLRALAAPGTGALEGRVLDSQGAAIAGVVCTLSGPLLPQRGLQVAASRVGKFDLRDLVWGEYTLTCSAIGYRPLSKTNLEVSSRHPRVEVQMVLPSETVLRESVEVHASAGAIPEQQTGAPPSTFVSQQLMTLPLAELKFKAALPLVPGVIRTPVGKLYIKGEPETRGLLRVDSADMVDPVSGSFSVEVPIDAIESLEVYKSPYLAQDGGFSGGLTEIHTKPPSDQWHWELNDMIPDFFFEGGHMRGIQDDSPRLYFTGPLLKNKLSVSESFLYDLNKQIVEGLPWPKNLRKREGFSSFTDFQFVFSSRHLFSLNARIFPKKDEFANIDALIPQPASEDYAQDGYALGATDRYLFASGGILTSTFEFTRFNTSAHGQGPEDMLVTPNGYGGNYFNAYRRWSNQEESQETYQFPQREWHGRHQLEIGAEDFRRAYTGNSNSHPVLVTGSRCSVLERINFSGPAALRDEDTEFGGFAQDHWLLSNHLSIDAGLRYTNETLGSHTAFAPRFGFAYSPGAGGRTVLRGGAGIFYDREPLLAADFPLNPTRTISFFSLQGTLLGPPVRFANIYGASTQAGSSILPSLQRPDGTPYDETWSVELDQQLRPSWLLRLSYLSSYGRDQFVVNPQYLPGGHPAFLLANTGRSHYQEIVSTVRVRPGEAANMNFSYVYSQARGDLNTLGELYVPFEQPIVRPNFYADLPSDMPNRFITWSEFHLPGAMTLSPVFDIHSGLPFSMIDARQNYVGVPNSSRYPHFYSLDLKWTKKFRMLLLPLAKGHIFRVGIAVFDITDRLNPLDVYNNNASPYFGHFVGFQHRTFATYFDLVK